LDTTLAAANALTSAAGSLAGLTGGAIGETGDGGLSSEAFGGGADGWQALLSGGASILRRVLGGKAGKIAGAASAGAIVGAEGSGFGIAGLGTVGGALLGGILSGGLAAGLMFGLPALFGGGKSPAERNAEIEQILEGERFTPPDSIAREVGFGSEGFGDVDYGAGNAPRIDPQTTVQVTVNAMDSRSFIDRAPDIAEAVRRAMLDMHPINMMVREAF
jgi:hypothetical protein